MGPDCDYGRSADRHATCYCLGFRHTIQTPGGGSPEEFCAQFEEKPEMKYMLTDRYICIYICNYNYFTAVFLRGIPPRRPLTSSCSTATISHN